jgi:hypothetical protein
MPKDYVFSQWAGNFITHTNLGEICIRYKAPQGGELFMKIMYLPDST